MNDTWLKSYIMAELFFHFYNKLQTSNLTGEIMNF